MIPFRLAIRRIEITGGSEYQIFAIRTEYRRIRLVPFIGHGIFFLTRDIVDIDDREIIIGHTGISQPIIIRRETYVAGFT